jgi:GH15 family glucan-1,4-alpha-glucosidase
MLYGGYFLSPEDRTHYNLPMNVNCNTLQDNLDYGVIGNCRSAALVSREGSIDWCCLPDFTSSSIFASLLDREKGGRFGFEPEGLLSVSQEYERNTNILVTRFETRDGDFEVIDFMPRYRLDTGYHFPPEIIRYLRPLRGRPALRVLYDPRLSYARPVTINRNHGDFIKSSTDDGPYESVYLYSNLDLDAILESRPIEVKDEAYFLFGYNQKLLDLSVERIRLEFERTKVYWLNWIDRTIHYTFSTDAIVRSALVLKLLTYQPSGAILAAVTTSLPEVIGGVRNWDYRYCWIRDASMIITTLSNLGHYNAARRFLDFILDVIPFKDEKIQIMYGIKGEKRLEEKELFWLSGYLGSQPVRVGNDAFLQKQNDIYGVLMDVIYQDFRLFRNTLTISEDLWTVVRGLARSVELNWRKPDKGIWEFRSGNKHFVFSKVLSWTALDRAVKIAELFNKLDLAASWKQSRAAIKDDILKKGWNPKVGAFTQYYGSENMDAANLLMHSYGFIEASDPKYIATVRKTRERLLRNGLMYRYRTEDDFGEPRTAFTVCTFWMIKSLYLIGEKEEAFRLFDELLSYGNHLKLFSEGIDFETRRLLGNFPQGYSHLALIDTAVTLSGKLVEDNDRILSILRSSRL